MIPYQEAPLDDERREACARALHLRLPDGSFLVGEQALLRIYRDLGYGALTAPFRWPPLSWAAAVGYRVVANNRPFFARFAFRTRE